MHSFTFERVITITFHFKVCFLSKTHLGSGGKLSKSDFHFCQQILCIPPIFYLNSNIMNAIYQRKSFAQIEEKKGEQLCKVCILFPPAWPQAVHLKCCISWQELTFSCSLKRSRKKQPKCSLLQYFAEWLKYFQFLWCKVKRGLNFAS